MTTAFLFGMTADLTEVSIYICTATTSYLLQIMSGINTASQVDCDTRRHEETKIKLYTYITVS